MSGILGIIEVPSPPVRRPAQHGQLLPRVTRRFGDFSLLEWIVRRTTECQLLDTVAVVADASQRDAVVRLTPANADVFTNKQPDALSRFAAAVRHFDAQQVVRVQISSPFVDPELIDRLICSGNASPGLDFVGYVARRGGPAVVARLGFFAEWCRASAILRADRRATSREDRSNATHFLHSHPEKFKTRMIAVPAELDRDDLRLTVHSDEDWDNADSIFDALGPEELNWQRIAGLLHQQPALRQRMAVLNDADHHAADQTTTF